MSSQNVVWVQMFWKTQRKTLFSKHSVFVWMGPEFPLSLSLSYYFSITSWWALCVCMWCVCVCVCVCMCVCVCVCVCVGRGSLKFWVGGQSCQLRAHLIAILV